MGHEGRVDRVDHEVVGEDREDPHGGRAAEGADQRALAPAHVAVEHARDKDEYRAEEEVRKLAHAPGRGEEEVDQVLDEANRHAAERPERKRCDQRRQLRQVELDEAGHERHGNADVHQHRGHGPKHGGHRQLADGELGVGAGELPWRGVTFWDMKDLF